MANAIEPKIYYHFTGEKLRDGSPIPPLGEWLELPANIKIKMCPSNDDLARGYGGLHASERPFDALQYAPGPLLHRVELDGIAERDSDKVVARRRKIIASIDATTLLRKFARKQALSVMHLWDAPEVVKRYLETGDESLRDGARAAAWDGARAASLAVAGDAAWDAAWAASLAAAGDAARDGAWAASLAAAGDGAWAAAGNMFAQMVDAAFAEAK